MKDILEQLLSALQLARDEAKMYVENENFDSHDAEIMFANILKHAEPALENARKFKKETE